MTTKSDNKFLEALGIGGRHSDREKEEAQDTDADQVDRSTETGFDSNDDELSLGLRLLENDFHPVLIFGTRATGKTTFLTSMLAFFTSMPDVGVTVTMGDQLSNSGAGVLAHESAERLFHLQVGDFINGTAPAVTQEAFPFFVPLELRKAGLQSITKIALMDSSGELWNVQSKKNNVQELRSEIVDIYTNYPKPLSVLVVVPYAVSEGYTGNDTGTADEDEFKTSDASLLQTLQIYQKNRPVGIKDQFYFVLTKWDMHTQMIASEEFFDPDEELVAELVEQRFPRSFNFFKGMSHGNAARCTPYSAGLIGGTKVLEIPRDLKPVLQEFPYRLWRWIYANSTDGDDLYATSKRYRGNRVANFFRELFS